VRRFSWRNDQVKRLTLAEGLCSPQCCRLREGGAQALQQLRVACRQDS
jgi:hypothetical protein